MQIKILVYFCVSYYTHSYMHTWHILYDLFVILKDNQNHDRDELLQGLIGSKIE